MPRELAPIAVQMLGRDEVGRLELPAMDEQQRVAARGELLDDRAADEPRAAENRDPHAVCGIARFGFFSTIRSIRPQLFACSGVMKKSRSIARSTSSSSRPQCLA